MFPHFQEAGIQAFHGRFKDVLQGAGCFTNIECVFNFSDTIISHECEHIRDKPTLKDSERFRTASMIQYVDSRIQSYLCGLKCLGARTLFTCNYSRRLHTQ